MNFFDLHCDTPYECCKQGEDFYENSLAVSGKKGEVFEKWRQVFAFWIKDGMPSPWETYKEIRADFCAKLAKRPENLTPLLAVEGGALIENDTERVDELKKDGISFITLTWNGENAIAGGCESDKGLTPFGKRVIEKMNARGIACDLSHLNEKSFFGAIEQSDFPLATHSACRALCEHRRNLTDSQISLLAQRGGIMGLVFYPEFLGCDVFEGIYNNIAYLCDKGYEDIIAIGSDFDGAQMSDKLCDISCVPTLYGYLKEKGLNEALLCKIFYENAYNFVAKLAVKG